MLFITRANKSSKGNTGSYSWATDQGFVKSFHDKRLAKV
jgi:hypothetical protein